MVCLMLSGTMTTPPSLFLESTCSSPPLLCGGLLHCLCRSLLQRDSFCKKNNFPSCFFQEGMVVCFRLIRENEYTRVWRSLVSRLTGGQEAAGSSPVTRTMSSVHNATEHSYVKEQSKGCSFSISMRPSAPMERLRLLHFLYPALPTRYSTATPWRLSSTTLSGYSSTSGISRTPIKL